LRSANQPAKNYYFLEDESKDEDDEGAKEGSNSNVNKTWESDEDSADYIIL
jgi:hypothetical protein